FSGSASASRRPRSSTPATRRSATWTPPRRSRPTRRRSGPTRPRCALNARPRVVVYVTRERPGAGAGELLVFDILDEPDFTAVVPGGRVEPGETIAAAAGGELAEGTGRALPGDGELGGAARRR